MYKLRKEDISLNLYIKDVVLQDFIEKQEAETLVLSDELSTSTTHVYDIQTSEEPNPFDIGRGIVYFDEGFDICLVDTATISGTPEQANRVVVYDNLGNIIPDTEYMVDYVDGRIITSPSLNPYYIDYYWNYISVVDEWPVDTASSVPIIVVDIQKTKKKGYQLGAGKFVNRKVNLHIFASSKAERNDLVEVLYNALYLKSCALYDLEKGTVLDSNGIFYGRNSNTNKSTNLFSRATVSGTSNLMFEEVESKNINLPLAMARNIDNVMFSNLNANRARIIFDMVSYTNS